MQVLIFYDYIQETKITLRLNVMLIQNCYKRFFMLTLNFCAYYITNKYHLVEQTLSILGNYIPIFFHQNIILYGSYCY